MRAARWAKILKKSTCSKWRHTTRGCCTGTDRAILSTLISEDVLNTTPSSPHPPHLNVYIESLGAVPELPQTLPKLSQGLPGLAQAPQAFLGVALQAKWPKSMEGLSKIEVSEFSAGSAGSTGSRQSGGSKRALDPSFHTRRGPG